MKFSQLASFGLLAAGAASSLRILNRRRQWETQNRAVRIVVDYDDAVAVSLRSGIALPEVLARLHAAGATDIALHELTLNRLRWGGRLVQVLPTLPPSLPTQPGRNWISLASTEPGLVELVLGELQVRLPQLEARRLEGTPTSLTYSGDLHVIGEIGLGFETESADLIHAVGLGVVPRPVSYAWADRPLIDRTLTQAAVVGNGIVAFEGDLILGHEMHLNDTVEALARNRLAFAYFVESRSQRGDWFIAKQRLPSVTLSHRLSRAEMISEDFHSAAHLWGMLARERGIRLFLVEFFRVVHATDPLECLHYLEHIVEAIQAEGLERASSRAPTAPLTVEKQETLLAGLAAAGAAALAVNETLALPEPLAIGVTLAAVAAPLALTVLDRPRNELERTYAPSYTPKLLALALTVGTPVAAAALARKKDLAGLTQSAVVQVAAAGALGALTTGTAYQMRVEEYRGLDLDLLAPLAAAAWGLPGPRARAAALAVGLFGWYALRKTAPDLLGRLDLDHAEGHTHHLSASGRLIGDMGLILGPRPARKWAWLGPVAGVLAASAGVRGEDTAAALLQGVSGVGNALALAGFRRPERAIERTGRSTLRNYAPGAAAAFVLLLFARRLTE